MTTTTTTGAGDTSALTARREAFERTAADREAVDLSTAAPFNLDAVYAAGQAVAIARWLQPYRPQLLRLYDFDIAHLDKLEDYALAMLYAHTTLVRRAARERQMPALAEEGRKLRTLLLGYGDVLAVKDVFNAKVLSELREGRGHRDLVEDLLTLVEMYQERPEVMAPGGAVTSEDVARAAEVGSQMLLEFGHDQEPDLSYGALVEARHKMAHLLITSHGQLRRAMTYLRYAEGDALTLVPSLHVPAKRRGGSGSADEEDDAHAHGEHHDLAALHDALHDRLDPNDPDENPFIDG